MRSKFYTRLTMAAATVLMFTFAAFAQTTISVQVAASEDDAEEYRSAVGGEVVGNVDITSSDLELVFDSEAQYVGMIFRNVAIPAGSTITNAYVQFEVDYVGDPTSGAITLEVYGAKEANITGAFTLDPFSVSSHPATTAKVTWSPPPSVAVDDRGVNEQTPDLSSIITEIIGLAGWASGNSMMIVVTGDPNQTENINREMESWDGEATAAPTLNVTFTEGGTGIDANKEFAYSVYPNPTEGRLYIDNPSNNDFSYEIFNISGQMVASRYNLAGSTTELDMSGFANGMYFVNVTSAERTETHKLILK